MKVYDIDPDTYEVMDFTVYTVDMQGSDFPGKSMFIYRQSRYLSLAW